MPRITLILQNGNASEHEVPQDMSLKAFLSSCDSLQGQEYAIRLEGVGVDSGHETVEPATFSKIALEEGDVVRVAPRVTGA